MASHALLIEVRLLDRFYHGVGDWPPSPFRLFQALVAGAYGGRWVAEPAADKDAAFAWLERQAPPLIAAPPKRALPETKYYVPNNDLDAKGGDPARVAEIRTGKTVRPIAIEADAPFLYAWPFDDGEDHAALLARLAERVYRLGRGIDPAFARAEITAWPDAEDRLFAHGGPIARPGGRGRASDVPCPKGGSFASLKARFASAGTRYERHKEGRATYLNYNQPPKTVFRPVGYDRPPIRILYTLGPANGEPGLKDWPLKQTAKLVETIRNLVAVKLLNEAEGQTVRAQIERLLIGRGAGEADKAQRIRIIPLPSIGFVYADPSIRRVLVEVPPDCPLDVEDLIWAFGGLDLNADPETGEINGDLKPVLVEAKGPAEPEPEDDRDRSMLRHYGIDAGLGARHLWRTITPAALPIRHRRGRLSGPARAASEATAVAAIRDALRHADISEPALAIRVQRDPWRLKGERAEDFATDRFGADQLWHVEIAFARPIAGPLILGDGRYCGLGLMAPERDAVAKQAADLALFAIAAEVRPSMADRVSVLNAVRRALMSLSRTEDGGVPALFSGHLESRRAARPGHHGHIFLFALPDADGRIDRIGVAAPWLCDRSWIPSESLRILFSRVLTPLSVVRAGRHGVLHLTRVSDQEHQSVKAPAREWRTITPYRPTRHGARHADPITVITTDVREECARRKLPMPEVEALNVAEGPRGGLSAELRLQFGSPVQGPILLGRDAHAGGGCFWA